MSPVFAYCTKRLCLSLRLDANGLFHPYFFFKALPLFPSFQRVFINIFMNLPFVNTSVFRRVYKTGTTRMPQYVKVWNGDVIWCCWVADGLCREADQNARACFHWETQTFSNSPVQFHWYHRAVCVYVWERNSLSTWIMLLTDMV